MPTATKRRPKRRSKVTTAPFKYSQATTPKGYKCGDCGATGVKLWREWNTFLDHQVLRCVNCACGGKKRDMFTKKVEPVTAMDCQVEHLKSGTLAAAIPTEDGSTYWGYSSVPALGCIWWYNLPGPRWTLDEVRKYLAQYEDTLKMWNDELGKVDRKNDERDSYSYYSKLKKDSERGIKAVKKILEKYENSERRRTSRSV